MSNGKTHEKINVTLAVILLSTSSAITIFSKFNFYETVFVFVGYLVGTYFIGPDLDLKSNNFYRWRYLRFIWLPYQSFKHRSIWTHGHIIGDIIRYAYLYAIAFICYLAFVGITYSSFNLFESFLTFNAFLRRFDSFIFFFFAGNVCSSSVHIVTDKISSKRKRLRKFI